MVAKITNYDDVWMVGVGWTPLLELVKKSLKGVSWGWKEKYGLLRIEIYSPAEEDVHEIADFIEELSGHICENCGYRGSLRMDGWNKTMCDKCYDEWMTRNNDARKDTT